MTARWRMRDPQRATAQVLSCHAPRPRRSRRSMLFDALMMDFDDVLLTPASRRFNAVLELVVTAPGIAEPYRVVERCNIDEARWPQPGDVVPVTIDAADPTRIALHLDEVPLANERAGAQRTAAARQRVEQRLRAAAPPQPVPTSPQQRLAQLERLHAIGALTDAELARERQRVPTAVPET
jgi:hypothetical protein